MQNLVNSTTLGSYEYVKDQHSLSLLLIDAKKEKYLGIDTENSGGLNMLDPKVKLLLFQIEVNGKAYVIDARKVDLSPLREILEDKKYIKIIQNAVHDYKVLSVLSNIYIKGIFDTQIAESLLNAGVSKNGTSLYDLSFRYLDYKLNKDTVKSFFDFPYDGEFTEDQLKYAAEDVLVLPKIRRRQQMYLNELKLNTIAELEFALIPSTAKMELAGIRLDADKWRTTLTDVKKRLFKISNDIRQILPDPPEPPPKPIRLKKDGTPYANTAKPKPTPVLNLNSWQQLAEACAKIGIDLEKANKKTRAGLTNNATIKFATEVYKDDKIKHKVLSDILQYRTLKQTEKTFGENLLDHISSDGKIHANFHQLGTASGRFSSSNPNLQNIQKKGLEGKILRSCFIPDDNCKFVISDYSQIELRIAAELSCDEKMIEILNDPSGDIHSSTAAEMYNIEQVSKDLRSAAKTINFGIIYGMSEKTLAERLNCSVSEAKEHLQKYRETYPTLMSYVENEGIEAFLRGYSKTIGGRIRWFPSLNKNDEDYKRKKAFYERVGQNHPIQGCMPADTKVLTSGGWVKIGDFSSGLVWTGEKWANATKVYRGQARRLRLQLSDGRKFDCDDRHYLLVNDGVYPRWESMDNIVGKPLVRDIGYDWGCDKCSIEDWYWVGRMIGDGYLSNFGWGCAFGNSEIDEYNRFISWLDTKDIKGITSSKRGYGVEFDRNDNIKVYGYTKKGKELWQSFGLIIGSGARDKRIPDIVFTLDRKRRQSVIDGFLDSDGYKRKSGNKFTSVNRLLLEDTLRLLQTVGITGRISKPMTNNTGCEWYELNVHKSPHMLTVDRVDKLMYEDMFTLSVEDDRHSFSSEGLISKNTSANMTKLSMIYLDRVLWQYDAKIVNTIHDELCVEVPNEYAVKVAKIVKRKMIIAGQQFLKKVPILVDVKIRDCWFKDDGVEDNENYQQFRLFKEW